MSDENDNDIPGKQSMTIEALVDADIPQTSPAAGNGINPNFLTSSNSTSAVIAGQEKTPVNRLVGRDQNEPYDKEELQQTKEIGHEHRLVSTAETRDSEQPPPCLLPPSRFGFRNQLFSHSNLFETSDLHPHFQQAQMIYTPSRTMPLPLEDNELIQNDPIDVVQSSSDGMVVQLQQQKYMQLLLGPNRSQAFEATNQQQRDLQPASHDPQQPQQDLLASHQHHRDGSFDSFESITNLLNASHDDQFSVSSLASPAVFMHQSLSPQQQHKRSMQAFWDAASRCTDPKQENSTPSQSVIFAATSNAMTGQSVEKVAGYNGDDDHDQQKLELDVKIKYQPSTTHEDSTMEHPRHDTKQRPGQQLHTAQPKQQSISAASGMTMRGQKSPASIRSTTTKTTATSEGQQHMMINGISARRRNSVASSNMVGDGTDSISSYPPSHLTFPPNPRQINPMMTMVGIPISLLPVAANNLCLHPSATAAITAVSAERQIQRNAPASQYSLAMMQQQPSASSGSPTQRRQRQAQQQPSASLPYQPNEQKKKPFISNVGDATTGNDTFGNDEAADWLSVFSSIVTDSSSNLQARNAVPGISTSSKAWFHPPPASPSRRGKNPNASASAARRSSEPTRMSTTSVIDGSSTNVNRVGRRSYSLHVAHGNPSESMPDDSNSFFDYKNAIDNNQMERLQTLRLPTGSHQYAPGTLQLTSSLDAFNDGFFEIDPPDDNDEFSMAMMMNSNINNIETYSNLNDSTPAKQQQRKHPLIQEETLLSEALTGGSNVKPSGDGNHKASMDGLDGLNSDPFYQQLQREYVRRKAQQEALQQGRTSTKDHPRNQMDGNIDTTRSNREKTAMSALQKKQQQQLFDTLSRQQETAYHHRMAEPKHQSETDNADNKPPGRSIEKSNISYRDMSNERPAQALLYDKRIHATLQSRQQTPQQHQTFDDQQHHMKRSRNQGSIMKRDGQARVSDDSIRFRANGYVNSFTFGPKKGDAVMFETETSDRLPAAYNNNVLDRLASETGLDNGVEMQASTNNKRKSTFMPFPQVLMQAILESNDDSVVAWLPDGKSIVIVNPERFWAEVLQGTFPQSKQSKYDSFIRKLHRWGFTRLAAGTGMDCFYHPYFQRDHPEMASKIEALRPPNKKEGAGTARTGGTGTTSSRRRPSVRYDTTGIQGAFPYPNDFNKPSLEGLKGMLQKCKSSLNASKAKKDAASSSTSTPDTTTISTANESATVQQKNDNSAKGDQTFSDQV